MTGEKINAWEAWLAMMNDKKIVEAVAGNAGPIEEGQRPRFRILNDRLQRLSNKDEDWTYIDAPMHIWNRCYFRVVGTKAKP